ncbi:MAG TPA: hypothetical protein VHU86_11395 [Solirubrobacterales bacterium]|nr:hypothetical protein [Solirubrobacterales bacterium]
MTAAMGEQDGRDDMPPLGRGEFPLALAALESAVLGACSVDAEWPAQITAGIYAGVDFAIANPAVVQALALEETAEADRIGRYEEIIGRLAGFIRIKAPVEARLPASTDEALVAGIVGLVGDHVRTGRLERLLELQPELVLLTLLPYLGFLEAQRWANRAAGLKADEA